NIVRKAMEMDFSKYGFPPLYIGAIVGYSWFDGQIDELEAPVYMLNEKREEVNKALEEGRELPSYDDPKKVWQEDIERFSIRTIEEEYKKGYKDKETGEMKKIKSRTDLIKNGRLVTYADRFGMNQNALMVEVMENGHEGVYERLEDISNYKTELASKLLKNIKIKIDKQGYNSLDEAAKDKELMEDAFYFGEHKWSVITWLLDEDLEDVKGEVKDRIDSDEYEKVVYDKPVKQEGKDITEEFETLNLYIKKKKLRYNKKKDRIRLYVEYDDVELFKHIDSMLVAITGMEMFKDDLKRSGFGLIYEDGSEYVVKSYKMFHKFNPILKELMRRHIMGTGYFGMEDKIMEVGDSLLKDEVLDGTMDEQNLRKLSRQYKESQTTEGRRKIERLHK